MESIGILTNKRLDMNRSNLLLYCLLVTLCSFIGCGTTKSPDPLDSRTGWNICVGPDLDTFNSKSKTDYQAYIRSLGPQQPYQVGPIMVFADGTGRHAVRIEIFGDVPNVSRIHVLVYDTGNKRVKVVTFRHRHAS
jgi:hypothetical protein